MNHERKEKNHLSLGGKSGFVTAVAAVLIPTPHASAVASSDFTKPSENFTLKLAQQARHSLAIFKCNTGDLKYASISVLSTAACPFVSDLASVIQAPW